MTSTRPPQKSITWKFDDQTYYDGGPTISLEFASPGELFVILVAENRLQRIEVTKVVYGVVAPVEVVSLTVSNATTGRPVYVEVSLSAVYQDVCIAVTVGNRTTSTGTAPSACSGSAVTLVSMDTSPIVVRITAPVVNGSAQLTIRIRTRYQVLPPIRRVIDVRYSGDRCDVPSIIYKVVVSIYHASLVRHT